jgi:hypothetical protein
MKADRSNSPIMSITNALFFAMQIIKVHIMEVNAIVHKEKDSFCIMNPDVMQRLRCASRDSAKRRGHRPEPGWQVFRSTFGNLGTASFVIFF